MGKAKWREPGVVRMEKALAAADSWLLGWLLMGKGDLPRKKEGQGILSGGMIEQRPALAETPTALWEVGVAMPRAS